jgi:hypothetical protein
MLFDLFAQRGYYSRGAVPNIEAADTTRKVEIAIAIDIFQSGAFRRSHENRGVVVGSARNRGFSSFH